MVCGIERMQAASAVLRRTRIADPHAGIWESADVQWWWRQPRSTDELDLPVWSDGDGPVGVLHLTDFNGTIQADALVVPGTIDLATVWAELPDGPFEVLARDDDAELHALLAASGFAVTDEGSAETWLAPADRPPVAPVADGYVLVDRTERTGVHPMAPRNGEHVEARLNETELYDPTLDLSVETLDGEPAGYALFWNDPVTGVGMLEPMRVLDEHQRRGLARALLTEGIDRLARRGAARLKVGFDGPAGKALYTGAGFGVGAAAHAWRRD